MTVFNSYFTNANYFYSPLSASNKGVNTIPNLADGLFDTPSNLPLKEIIKDFSYPIQYKSKGFDNYYLSQIISNINGIFKDYNATASLIQVGLRNDLHLEELNSIVFPTKI